MSTKVITLLAEGQTYLEKGNMVKAADVLAKAVAEDPTHAYAHFHYAEALEGADDNKKALVMFRKAIELDPGIAEEQIAMGLDGMLQGPFGQAVKEYKIQVQGGEAEADPAAGPSVDELMAKLKNKPGAPPPQEGSPGGDPMTDMAFEAPLAMDAPAVEDPMMDMAFEVPPEAPAAAEASPAFEVPDVDPMVDMFSEPPPGGAPPPAADPMAGLFEEPPGGTADEDDFDAESATMVMEIPAEAAAPPPAMEEPVFEDLPPMEEFGEVEELDLSLEETPPLVLEEDEPPLAPEPPPPAPEPVAEESAPAPAREAAPPAQPEPPPPAPEAPPAPVQEVCAPPPSNDPMADLFGDPMAAEPPGSASGGNAVEELQGLFAAPADEPSLPQFGDTPASPARDQSDLEKPVTQAFDDPLEGLGGPMGAAPGDMMGGPDDEPPPFTPVATPTSAQDMPLGAAPDDLMDGPADMLPPTEADFGAPVAEPQEDAFSFGGVLPDAEPPEAAVPGHAMEVPSGQEDFSFGGALPETDGPPPPVPADEAVSEADDAFSFGGALPEDEPEPVSPPQDDLAMPAPAADEAFSFGGALPEDEASPPPPVAEAPEEEEAFSFGADADEVPAPAAGDEEAPSPEEGLAMELDMDIIQVADPDKAGKEITHEAEDVMGRDLGIDGFWDEQGQQDEGVAFGGTPEPEEPEEAAPVQEEETSGFGAASEEDTAFADMFAGGGSDTPTAQAPPAAEGPAPASAGDDFLASLGVDLDAAPEPALDPGAAQGAGTKVYSTPTESWAQQLDEMEPHESAPPAATAPWLASATGVHTPPPAGDTPAGELDLSEFGIDDFSQEAPVEDQQESGGEAAPAGGLDLSEFGIDLDTAGDEGEALGELGDDEALGDEDAGVEDQEQKGVTQTLRWLNPPTEDLEAGQIVEVNLRVDDLYGVTVAGEAVTGEIVDKDKDGLTFLTPDRPEGISVYMTETQADMGGIASFAVQLGRATGVNPVKFSTMHSEPLQIDFPTAAKQAAKLTITPKGGLVPGGITVTARARAMDAHGNPVAGVKVTFEVLEHEGSLPTFLGPMGGVSSPQGEVSLQFRMPEEPGAMVRLSAKTPTITSISVTPLIMEVRGGEGGDGGGGGAPASAPRAMGAKRGNPLAGLLAKVPFLGRGRATALSPEEERRLRVQRKLNPTSGFAVKQARRSVDIAGGMRQLVTGVVVLAVVGLLGGGLWLGGKRFLQPAMEERKINEALKNKEYDKLDELFTRKLDRYKAGGETDPVMWDTLVDRLGKNRVNWAQQLYQTNQATQARQRAGQAVHAYLSAYSSLGRQQPGLQNKRYVDITPEELRNFAVQNNATPERRDQIGYMFVGLAEAFRARDNPGDCDTAMGHYRRAQALMATEDQSLEREIQRMKENGCP